MRDVMPFYYVNTNALPKNMHEVHKDGCLFLSDENNRKRIGFFHNCTEAVKEAEKYLENVVGCKYCSYKCHKG